MGLSPDDPRLGTVAYAKLQGDGLEYFIRKYEVLLGRKSKSTELDIVLGDNMNISRQHAKIAYNFALGVFELTVMGKNGVTVNGILHTPSSAPQQLYTQDFLQVGEQKFFFLLPKGTSRRRPPSASPPAKPESSVALLPMEGQHPATGHVMSEPMLMESGDPAHQAGRANTADASLNSMQPQLQHLDHSLGQQQLTFSAAPVHGQQQSLLYPSAYHIESSQAQT